MFVVEMIDYSERRNETPHAGRIRRLEDTDGDGRAETRERVFTGFGVDFAPFEVARLNMQAMLNSLRWGLDNRVYGLTGPNGGALTSPFWSNQPPVNVRRADLNATQALFLSGHRDPQVREQAPRVLISGPPTERDAVVRALLPQYVAYEIETRDEESLIGFVVDETATHLTLRQAYGQDAVLPRNVITRMTSGGRSIMPDELEAGLTREDIADLLEYLVTAGP